MREEAASEQNKKNAPIPSEEQIATYLEQLRPMPGPHFYRRMQSAPWMKEAGMKPDWRRGWNQRKAAALSALACLLLLAGVFAFPTLQAGAQQLLRFFDLSPSDQKTVKITIPTPGLQPTTFSTLDQAQVLVDFIVKQPQSLPVGTQLTGAEYDPQLQCITLQYDGPSGRILLRQHNAKVITEYSSVGSSAPIQIVLVGNSKGEYVTGGWRIVPDTMQPSGSLTPGTSANLRLYWDPELPQQMLRWEAGGISFEMICSSGKDLTKQDLIRIAESIQ